MNAAPRPSRLRRRSVPFSLSRPPAHRFDRMVRDHLATPLTYDLVGGTREELPQGWSHDQQTQPLGHGEACYQRAVQALRGWAQFDLGWVYPPKTDVPIREGELFAFGARFLGMWFLNVCRIVYVIDERDEPGARFGFAYGTLGSHAVVGEEQFVVHLDANTGEVGFTIRKFSRPAGWLFKMAGPVTRWLQHRFTVEALARLAEEVAR